MDKELFTIWRTWQQTARPVENFRSGAEKSPSYSLECQLDHSASWISGLAQEVINGGVRGDPWLRIIDEQVELENQIMALDASTLPYEHKERLRAYIQLSQVLLEKLAQAVRGRSD